MTEVVVSHERRPSLASAVTQTDAGVAQCTRRRVVSKLEFRDLADIDYPIIDSDAHVNEPPDLWQTRVPAKLRDRAPKVEHRDDGDYWSFDDGKRTRPLGFTAVAG